MLVKLYTGFGISKRGRRVCTGVRVVLVGARLDVDGLAARSARAPRAPRPSPRAPAGTASSPLACATAASWLVTYTNIFIITYAIQ